PVGLTPWAVQPRMWTFLRGQLGVGKVVNRRVKYADGMTLTLVPATLADREEVWRWMTTPGIVERMMGPPLFPDVEPPDWDEFKEDWVPHFWTHDVPEQGRCFILMDSEHGQLGLFAHNDVILLGDGRRGCELDMWLRSPVYMGRGYGPRALELLCTLLARELGVAVAFLQPSARNPGAIRAYAKAGFTRFKGMPTDVYILFGVPPDYHDSVFMWRDITGLAS
ncbi:MAG: GNAT family N-acetyltransferase, partial [Myxococcota bacterium]